jgi:hypothetical protein
MRIVCEKGFYKFYPDEIVELRRFVDKYGVDLVECEDFFTFEVLANLPNFSFKGQPYSGAILGVENYAAKKEEVMAINGFAYQQQIKGLAPTSLISGQMDYAFSNYIVMDSLPQAYFFDKGGVINGFNGFVDVDFMKFKIERFFYESI